ncbi:MAG: response regulator [Leptolyngbya sp.]|nr:response regulator [Leptolyngbya sp.]
MTKILVIEDEKGVQDNVVDILQLEGFQVIFADNGLLGVLMARAEHPDLIICDIMMPELDGYGVLEQLRQDPDTAIVPFIFLTAKADKVDLRQGMESGADDYLTKPFTPQELRQAVKVRLEKQNTMMEKYYQERERAQEYQRESQERQNIIDTQEDFLRKVIVDLRNPLSNINVAIQLLASSEDEAVRARYLTILREECSKEIMMLNQMAQLQDLMSPKNLKLLNQFKLIE